MTVFSQWMLVGGLTAIVAGWWLVLFVLLRRPRKSPRGATVARSARGTVAPTYGGRAAVVFPTVPAVTSVPGGHRAGRAAPPGACGRPAHVRLDGARPVAPRRAAAAVPASGAGAAALPRPARVGAGPLPPGRDTQTAVLARVEDQPTETMARIGGAA